MALGRIPKLPLYIDIAFCVVLLPSMIMLLPIERWLVYNSVFVYLLVGWLYVVYWVNRKLTVPFLFRDQKRLIWAFILIALTVIGTYLITSYQMEISPWRQVRRPHVQLSGSKFRLHQQAVWFLFVISSAFSLVVGLLTELYRQMMARQQVEFEKSKAELALYKAQINPHFLFNTLNTLYGFVVTVSAHAETAFMRFIKLMRYMYENGSKDQIPVSTEIEYIEQYIELQKYRIPKEAHIYFSYEHDETECLCIAPMILITFVENAIKYGISSSRPSEIYISIRMEKGELLFTTQNAVLSSGAALGKKGIGIRNCRKRLELLYPGKFLLRNEERDGMYLVTLTIELNK